MGAEVGDDDLERHVREAAAVGHIFHVLAPRAVERLKKRIRPPVEFERPYAQALTQARVEGRRRLHPFALEVQLAIGMPAKHVGLHALVEPRRRHVGFFTSAKPRRLGTPSTRAPAASRQALPTQNPRLRVTTALARKT